MDVLLQQAPPAPPKHKNSKHRRNRSTGSLGTGSITNLFQKTLNPKHHLRNRVIKKAATVVESYATELANKSPYLLSCDTNNSFEESASAEPSIPLLDRSEIILGRQLGEGQFCHVHEIVGISRGNLSQCPRQVVLKNIRKRLGKDPRQFTVALADLVGEAQYLSQLCHPHILSVRGMTRGGLQSMQETGKFDSYFLVLDRLETTLDQRIPKWARGQEIPPSLDQKLAYALQLAQALEYLHQRRIIFRDCRPQNIGFRADNGTLSLFDFGLCRELPPPRERPVKVVVEEEGEDGDGEDQEEEDPDDYYLMTQVGTRRYSAVEMYISSRYNEKADVYSWAMTVYEMISMCTPFAKLSDEDHQELVCSQGKRPNAKPFLHQCGDLPSDDTENHPLMDLLRVAWEQYVRLRIDMATVVEGMEDIIAERQQLQKEQQEAVATADKELTESIVSATAETVAESLCSDSPVHPQNDNPPLTPNSNSSTEEVHVAQHRAPIVNTRSDGAIEEDAISLDGLIPVDIAVSRHSVTSTSTDHSSLLEDSMGLSDGLTEMSLNSMAFDEFLKPRHRGGGLRGSMLEAPTDTPCAPPASKLNVPLNSPLSPPHIQNQARANNHDYLPESMAIPTTPLKRIVSRNLQGKEDEEE